MDGGRSGVGESEDIDEKASRGIRRGRIIDFSSSSSSVSYHPFVIPIIALNERRQQRSEKDTSRVEGRGEGSHH